MAMCARGETGLNEAAAAVKHATGAEVLAVPADVARAEDIGRVVAKTVEAFGSIDIVLGEVDR